MLINTILPELHFVGLLYIIFNNKLNGKLFPWLQASSMETNTALNLSISLFKIIEKALRIYSAFS